MLDALNKVLASAPDHERKLHASLILCTYMLDIGQAAGAYALAAPLVINGKSVRLELAHAAVRAAIAQGDRAGAEKIWRDVLAAEPGFQVQREAAGMLSTLLNTPAADVDIRRAIAADFRFNDDAHADLAQALVTAEKFDEALESYRTALALAHRNVNNQNNEQGYYDRMVDVCARACGSGDASRVVSLITTEFHAVNTWQIQNWLRTIQNDCGESASYAAALKLAESGGEFRYAAAAHVMTVDKARGRALYEAAGDDTTLNPDLRYGALQTVRNMGLTPAENILITRHMAALPVQYWQRHTEFQSLAYYLAQEGFIKEAIDTTEQGAPFLMEIIAKEGYDFSRY